MTPPTRFRLLRLSTPYMRGADVVRLQKHLKVKADGEYGPVTGSAVARWKRYAGYPAGEINQLIGTRGQRYMYGVDPLPKDYRERAIARRAAAQAQAKADIPGRALDVMLGWANHGYKEHPPESNVVPALVNLAVSLGVRDQPMMGTYWCEFAANLAALTVGGQAAREALVLRQWNGWYTIDAVRQAQGNKHHQRLVSLDAAPRGAKVYFNFGSRDFVQHVGRLVRVTARTVWTVDGNTSASGSQDNGGAVLVRERSRSTVRAVVVDA